MATKKALCIGVNDYPGTESDLHGCVNDANDWMAALEARGFECAILLDSGATGQEIRNRLKRLAKDSASGDVIVITFSGHGSFVPDMDGDELDGYDECWCPHDVVENGPITDDDLHTIFSKRDDNARWIVISDSCHSGTVARFSRINTPATTAMADAPQRLVRFLAPDAFMKEEADELPTALATTRVNASPPGRKDSLLMSGCKDSEYSYDAWFEGRANGAFTFVALRELAELGADATYDQWSRAIGHSLPSQQYPQSPNLFGPKSMRKWIAFAAKGEKQAERLPAAGAAEASLSRFSNPFVAESWDIGRSMARDAIVRRGRRRTGAKARRTPIVAEGDSWFDLPFSDVLSKLEDEHQFDVHSVARRGDTVEDMAYSGGQLDALLREFDRLAARGERPEAILISGGGNDVVGDEFAQLLNHSVSPNRGVNEQMVEIVLRERMLPSYATIVSAVTEICEDRFGEALRILIHGYSYAVPDGRGFWGLGFALPGPWLKPGFSRKGYDDPNEMQGIVDRLIERLNTLQRSLTRAPGFGHVRHVDLLDVFPRDGDHRHWWQDELHPTSRGFSAVARRFADAIRA